jgi:hypothetical protein
MLAPVTFDLRIRLGDGRELRAVTGARLEIERRSRRLPERDSFHHDIGSGWASDDFDLDAIPSDEVRGWDLEIGEASAELADAVHAAIAGLLPRDQAAEVAVLAGDLPSNPMPWHAEWVSKVPPALESAGAHWFDVMVPSVNWRQGNAAADPVIHCRHARIVWTEMWCVTIWSARKGAEPSDYRTWGLPDRPPATTPLDPGGAATMAESLRAVLGHLEWSVSSIDIELETWEDHFLQQAATHGGVFVGLDLERLQRHLAALGGGISGNREALRTLIRRSEIQPGFTPELRELVDSHCTRLMKRSANQRAAMRESFNLIAGTASGQQFLLAQERAERDGVFHAVIGIFAAVFIAPGLVISIYGANVGGLPGTDEVSGLWFMLIGAMLVGALSMSLVIAVRRYGSRAKT